MSAEPAICTKCGREMVDIDRHYELHAETMGDTRPPLDVEALPDEDDFTHYFNATRRLLAELESLRAELASREQQVEQLAPVARAAEKWFDAMYGDGGRMGGPELDLGDAVIWYRRICRQSAALDQAAQGAVAEPEKSDKI